MNKAAYYYTVLADSGPASIHAAAPSNPSIMLRHLAIRTPRHIILCLLAMVLVAYAGLFQHLLTHHLDGEETHCAQCLATSHFGHVPSASLSIPDFARHSERPWPYAAQLAPVTAPRYFSARAPPHASLRIPLR